MTDEPSDTVLRIPIGTPSADVRALMEMMVLQNRETQERQHVLDQQRRDDALEREERRRDDLKAMEENRREDLLLRAASTAALKTQNDLAVKRAQKPLRMGVDFPQLPKLEDPRGITLFLDCFKRDMLRYEVPRQQWTAILIPQLDKQSAHLSRQLPLETQLDLDLLAKELLLLHGISPDSHRRAWAELKMNRLEDPLQYAVRVSFTMKSWVQDCATKEEATDRIATDKFMSGLDIETAQWTRNTNPSSCLRTAALFLANQRLHPKRRQLPDLPNSNNRSPRKMTPEEIAKAWDPVKGPRCFKCDIYGHVADDCPKKRNKPDDQKPTSKISNFGLASDLSHTSSSEDNSSEFIVSATFNGTLSNDVFVDNGTNLSAIDASFLPANFISCEPTWVKGLTGQKLFQTTMVKVDLNGFRFTTRMIVGTDFGHDALLGTEIPNLQAMLTHNHRKQPSRSCRRPAQTTQESSSDSDTEDRTYPCPASPCSQLTQTMDADNEADLPLPDEQVFPDAPPLLTTDLEGGSPQPNLLTLLSPLSYGQLACPRLYTISTPRESCTEVARCPPKGSGSRSDKDLRKDCSSVLLAWHTEGRQGHVQTLYNLPVYRPSQIC